MNYCLKSSGFASDDSLWALDSASYGVRLVGPALGALACKERGGGGHTFFIAGRTARGMLVGRGGNQSDMVCDALFDPSIIVSCNWPADYPLPPRPRFSSLPLIEPAPKVRKEFARLPAPTPRSGVEKGKAAQVALPAQVGLATICAAAIVGAAHWLDAHPAVVIGAVLTAVLLALVAVHRLHKEV